MALSVKGTGSFSNTAPSKGAPSGGGGGGSSGAAVGAASAISSAIIGVTNAIMSGKIQKAQADYNAVIMDGKAKWIQFQKENDARQYNRYRNRFISKSVASVAGAGLMLSGSPLAALVDSVTQINIDQSVSQANIQMEKEAAISASKMYTVEGKMAKGNATINAFSALLDAGNDYGLRKVKFDTEQGAKSAGRQS